MITARVILTYLVNLMMAIFWCPLMLFVRFTSKPRFYQWFNSILVRWWSRVTIRRAQIDLRVCGLDNIDPKQPYVICVAPHESHAEHFILPSAIGIPYAYIAKNTFWKTVVYALQIIAMGGVMIKRNRTAYKKFPQLIKLLENKGNVLVYPEGTRRKDGQRGLMPLKPGFTTLALGAKVPVLPVWISGTGNFLPPHTLRFCPGTQVTVTIGKPIPVSSSISADELMEQTRRSFIMLEKLSLSAEQGNVISLQKYRAVA